ncbi:MAG TPA: CoA pyrophosphatase [Proteobacteria bacterium]|nr:CoA pyrophosphatase [Pseudomonadota bacterium]
MPLEKLADFFSTYKAQVISSDEAVRAAVLCPLYVDGGELKILFIKRSQTVKNHKGEISFPGGVRDSRDESLEATSTRETEEEIGVKSRDITIFGGLDEINTTTGFLVSPFIGTIPYPYPFRLSADEVDDLISVPLDEFFHPRNEIDFFYFNGHQNSAQLAYHINGVTIWGATAKIVWQIIHLAKKYALFAQKTPAAYHFAS